MPAGRSPSAISQPRLARPAVDGQRQLTAGLGLVGVGGEAGHRCGVVAEQERRDRRVLGGPGGHPFPAPVDRGNRVPAQVTAALEPAGLVEDVQCGAPTRKVQLDAGVIGVVRLAPVEIEQRQGGPGVEIVLVGPGRGQTGRGDLPGVVVAARAREGGGRPRRDGGAGARPHRPRATATASSNCRDHARARASSPETSWRRGSSSGRRSRAICRNVACSSGAPIVAALSAASSAGSTPASPPGSAAERWYWVAISDGLIRAPRTRAAARAPARSRCRRSRRDGFSSP